MNEIIERRHFYMNSKIINYIPENFRLSGTMQILYLRCQIPGDLSSSLVTTKTNLTLSEEATIPRRPQ